MECEVRNWKDLYGKKIHILEDGVWREAYVTEDGLIYTGRTATFKELK